MKVDILAFGAHPDDVECAIAGVVLKHISMGKTVAIVDLTAGEMGSHGTPENRKQEANNAAKLLGASYREQLDLPDGGIENTEENRLKIINVIRHYQPDIILNNAVRDRHPDHGNASKLVSDANFLSGLKRIETTNDGTQQDKWRAPVVYNYIQDYFIQPDFVVDITDFMDKKIESILAYKSQFVDPKDANPNAIMGLLDQVKSMNTIFGRAINVRYAEGFTVNRYLGVTNFYGLE